MVHHRRCVKLRRGVHVALFCVWAAVGSGRGRGVVFGRRLTV